MHPALRRVLVVLGIAIGVAVLLALVAGGLLLRTSAGARWALSLVSGVLPGGTITAGGLSGSLSSPLVLEGFEYRTAKLLVRAERVEVHWRLDGLLRRSLEISLLTADRVSVRQLAPPEPDTSARPDTLPNIRLPIALGVDSLAVRGFAWFPFGRSADSAAFALDEAHGAFDFRDGRLRVSSLRASSPLMDANVRGELRPQREYPMDVNFGLALRLSRQPEYRGSGRVDGSLRDGHVTATLEQPFAATADARVTGVPGEPFVDGRADFSGLEPRDFSKGAPEMKLGGRIEARGTVKRFEASGRVSMRSTSLGPADADAAVAYGGDSLRVDRLIVTVPGRRERVQARGLLSGMGDSPRADFVAEWKDLVWPLTGDTLVRSGSGRMHFAGTPSRYDVRAEGGVASAREDFGTWRVDAKGDTARFDEVEFDGPLYGGHVTGAGTFAWKPFPSWNASVSADSLDPGRLWPEWPGRLGTELEVVGQMRDTTLQLEADIARLDGTLKHLPISGGGTILSAGHTWGARELRVEWGKARLAADGTAGGDWDLAASLEAPEIGPFLDGASGALRADLKLSGPRERPRVGITAQGDSLAFAAARAGELHVSMDAGFQENDPLDLDLEAHRAWVASRPLDYVSVEGSGSMRDHALRARAEAEGDTLVLEAGGSLARERWSGTIDAFELQTRSVGTWSLEAPVAVAVSAKEAGIDSFCVRSDSASVRGLLDWNAGEGFRARAHLAALPLKVLDRWLPAGSRLEGLVNGSLDASAERAEGPLLASVRLEQGPASAILDLSATERDTIRLGQGRYEFDSDATGARALVAVRWDSGDHLDAKLALPGFNALRPDTLNQKMEGTVQLRANELSALSTWLPGLDQSQGVLNADLTVGGTTRRPDIDGELSLRGGRALIPALGLTLQDAELTATFEPGHKITVLGSVRSGEGTVSLAGDADLERLDHLVANLSAKGSNVTIAKTREADVRVTPDARLKLDGSRIDLEGQVDIPFARLVTTDRLELPVPRSSDVVFVGQEPDSARMGPKLHSRVRLVLGEDVEIRVPGFRGRPEGSLLAIDEPGQVTRATGELSVREGMYRAYGQDLRIERGRLSFGGGPITNPGLDIRASRTASDGTVAGIQVTGTAEVPILTTFSVPAMSQADALSYIMFGQPLGETGGSGGAAAQAAGQLSLQGSDALARGVAGKVGIQDASIESKEGSMQEASLFLGTYLSPKLYVAYGIGLFNSETTVRVRYKLSNRWSVQSESGSAPSGLVQYTGEK